MSSRIMCRNTLYAVENIGFSKGYIQRVDYQHGTADIEIDEHTYYDVPVFYNAPQAGNVQDNGSLKNSAKAFCRGDEALVRMYKGEPSNIIGFVNDLWPCIRVPAFVFNSAYAYDETDGSFTGVNSALFTERYKEVSRSSCSHSFTTYINQPDADISTGFVSNQTHWTDTKFHRDSKFYYNGEFIYSTYNYETFSRVFNGTRSNILSSYIQPDTGWGALIYQVNTFYDWKPQVSGRVKFDFFLFTSTGTHAKLATAEADITGASTKARGQCVSYPSIYSSNDEFTGALLSGSLRLYEAGYYSSDGSTNFLGRGDCLKLLMIKLAGESNEPELTISGIPTNKYGTFELPDGTYSNSSYKLYIKNR